MSEEDHETEAMIMTVKHMSADDLRAERQAKQTALYQGRVKARKITATSKRVREIDLELRRRRERVF